MAQAADWTYRTLSDIRGTLGRMYGDVASRDFTSGLLTSDPTKGREIDTYAASYSRGRVNQYLDFVQPLLYQARDNSTSKEAREYFENQIDECLYRRDNVRRRICTTIASRCKTSTDNTLFPMI